MSKYSANVYFFVNFSCLMNSLETDDFDEAEDFILYYNGRGYNCKLIDNETGEISVYEFEEFNV